MKLFAVFLLLSWAHVSVAAPRANVNSAGVLLDGFDAVSYFQGAHPKKGDPKFAVKQGDTTYWFSSAENKQLFIKDPSKYAPQFGGWCAYAVANSKEKVEVDPDSFVIQDGRLLLFYNGLWADTRKKWLTTKDKDAKTFLNDADTNWPLVEKQAP